MQRVEKVLERVTELPFSPMAAKILALSQDDRVGAREIGDVFTCDQACTARLLKIANWPYYGQARAGCNRSFSLRPQLLRAEAVRRQARQFRNRL
jgi:HD-like signal output (HDOD) protein